MYIDGENLIPSDDRYKSQTLEEDAFRTLSDFSFQVEGITATADNNILLCVVGEPHSKKKKVMKELINH